VRRCGPRLPRAVRDLRPDRPGRLDGRLLAEVLTLAELARGLPTDKADRHAAYLPYYDELFGPLRTTKLPVIEVGVWRGGSLALWERYFTNASAIVGVELSAAALLEPPSGRTRVLFRDAYSEATVGELRALGPYAAIVDDGPHDEASQLFFVRRYAALLAPGGVAVVEDVPDLARAARLAAAAPPGFEAAVVDLRAPGSADDDVLVALRPRVRTGQFAAFSVPPSRSGDFRA
jgi:hypothetical protein